jgi:hypothetical protein
MLSEPVAVTLQVTGALERLGVPYMIGGSMASTAHGRIRTTMDVDIVADLQPDRIRPPSGRHVRRVGQGEKYHKRATATRQFAFRGIANDNQ